VNFSINKVLIEKSSIQKREELKNSDSTACLSKNYFIRCCFLCQQVRKRKLMPSTEEKMSRGEQFHGKRKMFLPKLAKHITSFNESSFFDKLVDTISKIFKSVCNCSKLSQRTVLKNNSKPKTKFD
jgi:hypothetical protein